MALSLLKRLWRPAPRAGYFDVFDPAQLRPLLERFGVPWPTANPTAAEAGVAGAVEFAVAQLLSRPVTWPLDSPGLRFAFESQGARSSRLSASGSANVRAAFTSRPGDKVRRLTEARLDLRVAFPLAYTPLGRGGFLAWMLEHGRAECGLTAAEALWFTAEQAADPSDGFGDAYLWQPAWQAAVPDALIPAGWPKLLAWVDRTYGPFGPWLHRTPAPPPMKLAARGVNVLGHFRYPSGLQEEAGQYLRALAAAGYATARRDIPVTYTPAAASPERYDDPEVYPISLVKIGAAARLDETYALAGLHPRAGVYRVACWSWELERFPAEAVARAGLADEVWTPTEFGAAAVRRAWPGKSVTAMLPAVAAPSGRAWPRSHFGLEAGRFLVMFLFDMGSVAERKNPLGLIRAFGLAFPAGEAVNLVIKVSRAEANPAAWARLQEAASRDARVVLVNRVMSREESLGLLSCCDCYCSLHRAEGFGFTIAEAMLAGKPTVATDYSGTRDFLSGATGFPVGYRLVRVGEGQAPFDADAVWAEPSEEEAAAKLRFVRDHPAEAGEVARRGAGHARALFSVEATAARMAARLREIEAALKLR